jgi:hypothetical protein
MRFGGVLLSPSMHRFLSVTCLAAATSFAVLACTHNAAAQAAAPLAVLAAVPGSSRRTARVRCCSRMSNSS